MSYTVYRPLRPSSSVDHSVQCSFTTAGAEELVVVRVNQLEVYRPSAIQGQLQLVMQYELSGEANSLARLPIDLETFTLEEREQWKHRLPEPGLDCLVLAFDEAKLTLVCFDSAKPRTLRTVALFNFEDTARGSELRASKVGLVPSPPHAFGSRAHAMVDSQNRCIATVVYSSYLAVVPLRQILRGEPDECKQELIRVLAGSDDEDEEDSTGEEDEDEKDEKEEEEAEDHHAAADEEHQRQQQLRTNRFVSLGGRVLKRGAQLVRECGNGHPLFAGRPHLLPLSAFGIGQHSAIAACFAEGTFTPTVLVLHTQPTRTWAARLGVYQHTCALTAVALCAENPLQGATRAWFAAQLPHDSLNVLACARGGGGGGALVVTSNALVYVSAVPRERVTMAVNAFAVQSCHVASSNAALLTTRGKKEEEQDEEDDTACFSFASTSAAVWLSSSTLLCVLASGELLQVSVGSRKLSCKLVGAIGGTSFCCSALFPGKQLVFFGSRSTDGVFLSYATEERVVMPTELVNKRVKLEEEEENKDGGLFHDVQGDAAYEDAIRAAAAAGEDGEEDEDRVSLLLEIVDRLPVWGPITDMDFSDALPTSTSINSKPPPPSATGSSHEDDLLAKAEKEASELARQQRPLQAQQVRERAQALVRAEQRRREQELARRDVDLVTVGHKSREEEDGADGPKLFSYACGYRLNLRSQLALAECSMLFSLGNSTLVVSESQRTRVFTLSGDDLQEQRQHALRSRDQATLFVGALRGGGGGVVQVLPTAARLFASSAAGLNKPQPAKHTLHLASSDDSSSIVQVCFEANTLLLVTSAAVVRAFAVSDELGFRELAPALPNVSSVACFVCPTTGKLSVCCVKTGGGGGGEEAGTLEIYEDFKLAFRGDCPLPLSPACLGNALTAPAAPTATDRAHRAGVLLNCPVVDLVALRCGTESNFKILLVAALGDGEVCVYERWGEHGQAWHRANHQLITRGLRGRQSRTRKYAQPVGARAFRGPVLHAFMHPELKQRCVLFAGHRPCIILCNAGRITAVPLASSVACTLPPPLVPVAAKSMDDAPAADDGGAAAKIPGLAGPADIYRARGAVHAFCALDSLLVLSLRAPELATAGTTSSTTTTTSTAPSASSTKSAALWFCSSAVAHAEDFAGGLAATAFAGPGASGNCTHVTFLPHASRGNKDESRLGLHAPTFALVSSREEPLAEASAAGATGEEEEDEGIPPPSTRFGGEPGVRVLRQRLDISRAPDYAMVCSQFDFDVDERVLACITANVDLPPGSELYQAMTADKNVRPQHEGVIIVGTGYINAKGEDAAARGRILVFKLDHVAATDPSWLERNSAHAGGRPSSRPMLRMIASVELRGPISAVASLDGKILAATGTMPCSVKLLELSSRNEGLIPIGFYDAPTCVTSMNVVRDQFVLLGDMNKSLHLVRWTNRQFYCLGKSFAEVKTFASEFVVDGPRLLLTAADEHANLRTWHYNPDDGGQFLQVRGEINIGVRVGKMRSKRMPPLPPRLAASAGAETDTAAAEAASTRWCLTMGTLAGGLSALVPVEEKVFRRLDLLQQAMVASALLPRNAGLHPLQCAQPRALSKRPHAKSGAGGRAASGTMVDGRILSKFTDLDKIAQIQLAMSVGSTVESILDTLLELELVCGW